MIAYMFEAYVINSIVNLSNSQSLSKVQWFCKSTFFYQVFINTFFFLAYHNRVISILIEMMHHISRYILWWPFLHQNYMDYHTYLCKIIYSLFSYCDQLHRSNSILNRNIINRRVIVSIINKKAVVEK